MTEKNEQRRGSKKGGKVTGKGTEEEKVVRNYQNKR